MPRPRRAAFIALALVALAFAACNNSSKPKSTPASGTAIASTGATAEFNEGVAAGDVTTTSAILWTRARGGDTVIADISRDETFAQIDQSIATETSADTDYTVKTKVEGLSPDTRYSYRFRAGDATSDTGRFATPPDPSASRLIRFVFAGDADGSKHSDGTPIYNNFEPLDAATNEQPDFSLFFGDTIYGDKPPPATTLADYRAKYKQNRSYDAMRTFLATAATYNTWDDHEVTDNFAGTTVDRDLFDAGRQAFQEYWPIDTAADASKMYREIRWGKDVDLILLDERSFRDAEADSACTSGSSADPLPGVLEPGVPDNVRNIRTFVGLPADLPDGCLSTLDDPSRTMLGDAQKQFLKDRLKSSDATWKVIVNEVPIQQLLALPYDRWEGYAAERREVLEYIRDNNIKNVVFLTTDFHANILGPVGISDFDGAPPVAYEAVVGPVATSPLGQDIQDVIGSGGKTAFNALLTGLVKVDCAEIDTYSYSVVDVDPAAATMTIANKDSSSKELCSRQLQAEQ